MRPATPSQLFAFRPAMTLIAAGLLLVAGALAVTYQRHQANAEHRRQLTVQAKILAASVTAAIAFNDRAAAQEYVNALMLDPRLDAVAVYSESHQQIAGFARPGSDPIPDPLTQRSRMPRDRLLVEVPARQDGTTVGSVYLRAAETPLVVEITRFSGLALLTIMALLMLSAVAVAQRTLTRANAALARRAWQLASANQRLSAEMEQRARTEEALRQSQKMEAIGQLSGGIAHDFNNLLMIIKSSLTRLQRRLEQDRPAARPVEAIAGEGRADDPTQARGPAMGMETAPDGRDRQIGRYLEMAQDAIDRAASLTQRLLSFARQQPLLPRPINLDDLIEGIRPLLDQSAGTAVRIEYRLRARWEVVCDPNQMESAILNLVINARDAMPVGGQVIISTDEIQVDAAHPVNDLPHGAYVRLRVIDHGVGMSEEVRRKAFDPFFTTKPVGKGTGLGLSTILGYLVQSHGAAILDSEPGRGTTVSLVLPRAHDQPNPEPA